MQRIPDRVVIKVGTSTLTYSTGHLNIRRIEALVEAISDIKNSGKQVILVSSGAIGVGMSKLQMRDRPTDIPSKQAAAAVGQCELMYMYDKRFSVYNHVVSQVLLTRDIIDQDERRHNARNTLNRLLELDVIPIINENDTISTDEIKFGDNDALSAMVGELVGADKLIIMSDIDGLFDKDPRQDPTAQIIRRVEKIDERVRAMAGGAGSRRGTGGMITKIHAAEIFTATGGDMVIINGDNPRLLYDVFDGKPVGTTFVGQEGEK